MKRQPIKPTYAHTPVKGNPPCITCGYFKPYRHEKGGICQKVLELLKLAPRQETTLGRANGDTVGCKYWQGRRG